MKLDIENHEFLAQVALTLKVEQDHAIEVFNATTIALMKSDNDAMKSIEAYKLGKMSKDRLNDEINTVSDLAVVQAAYDKLSDAYIEAFDVVSAHHMARMKADPAYVTN